jgi:hypothetical protein
MQGVGPGKQAAALFEQIGDVLAGEVFEGKGIFQCPGNGLGTVDLAQGHDLLHVVIRVHASLFKFIGASKMILQMAMAAIYDVKAVSEKIVQTIMDAAIGTAIIFYGLDKSKSTLISETQNLFTFPES